MSNPSSRRLQLSFKSLFLLAIVAGLVTCVSLATNEAIRQTRIAEQHAAEAMMQRDYSTSANELPPHEIIAGRDATE